MKHIHYWIIDPDLVGHCRCGASKNFRILQEKEGVILSKKQARESYFKRFPSFDIRRPLSSCSVNYDSRWSDMMGIYKDGGKGF